MLKLLLCTSSCINKNCVNHFLFKRLSKKYYLHSNRKVLIFFSLSKFFKMIAPKGIFALISASCYLILIILLSKNLIESDDCDDRNPCIRFCSTDDRVSNIELFSQFTKSNIFSNYNSVNESDLSAYYNLSSEKVIFRIFRGELKCIEVDIIHNPRESRYHFSAVHICIIIFISRGDTAVSKYSQN